MALTGRAGHGTDLAPSRSRQTGPAPWLPIVRRCPAVNRSKEHAMKSLLAIPLLLGTLALAACGQTTGDRAVSGGLLGAGTGAAIGGITGGSVGTGALLGGAAGAAGGALTTPRDVDLGRPAWRR